MNFRFMIGFLGMEVSAPQLEFSTYYCKEQSYLVVICNIQRCLEMTRELSYCRFVFGFVILPTLITCVFSRQECFSDGKGPLDVLRLRT